MPDTKKILFISCSAGSGHIKAAEALRLACGEKYPQVDSWHFNISDDWNFLMRHSVTSPYDFTIKHYPALYGAAYKLTDSSPLTKAGQLFNFMFRFGVHKHLDKISEFNPDAILYTHFIPALMLSKFLSVPQYILITDYYAHKIWRVPNMKAFFVPTEETKKSMGKFAPDCEVTGLPINPEFKKEKNTAELKQKLGIAIGKKVILFMPTVPGGVDVAKAITSLRMNEEFEIVAIAGKNNVDEYMRVADLIITKAGGMTITEIAYLRKPMIIVNPIPGQEELNAEIFEKKGLCALAADEEELLTKTKAALSGQLTFVKQTSMDAAENILRRLLAS